MHLADHSRANGSEGLRAPPIKSVAKRPPVRLARSRARNIRTPQGAVYVGKPTFWGNPFSYLPKVGHARSVILYRHWLAGDLSIHVFRSLGYSQVEINGLLRWRAQLIRAIPRLRGRDLQCWCPLTSAWCHADTLLRLANAPLQRPSSTANLSTPPA